MSITMSYMRTRAQKEASWNSFLAGLKSWEWHRLQQQEMMLHDEFIAGNITLRDVRLTLSFVVEDLPDLTAGVE